MKERHRTAVVLLFEQNFRNAVGRRTGEVAVTIIVEHELKTGPCSGGAVKRAIAFTEVKCRAGAARRSGKLPEEFFVFGNREIVELAREERVRVVELTFVGRLFLDRRRFGFLLRRRRLIRRYCTRSRCFIDRLGTANFRCPLRGRAGTQRQKQPCGQDASRGPREPHFAVANATLVTPACVQTLSTETMFL